MCREVIIVISQHVEHIEQKKIKIAEGPRDIKFFKVYFIEYFVA